MISIKFLERYHGQLYQCRRLLAVVNRKRPKLLNAKVRLVHTKRLVAFSEVETEVQRSQPKASA